MLSVLLLTLKVAASATAVVLVPAVFLGYALARWKFRGQRLLSALIGLPMVLPPTAVGFLLLRLLASHGPLGRETLGFDLGLVLTWKGAVLAASVMSIPLVVRTARVTFESIDPRLETMARTLGFSPLSTFFRITLPLARRGLLAAVILGFTRSLGEFGATVTLAGNIPGRTQTLASAIFSAQQSGDPAHADFLMVIAVFVGFIAIVAAELLARPLAEGGR
ncbi:MAG: molybdate ABC transporter permease subunit [Acidobacteria bacterium]|nr:molybdate ABC transporter permease subunit [Acidobacteriota bacterium]